MSAFESTLGAQLLTKGGLKPTSEVLAGKKYVFVYLSAHWCPPCRRFTPILAEFYKEQKDQKNFEIVFVSYDRDEASFAEYYAVHPWTAIPFSSSANIAQSKSTYGAKGIPELVVLDAATGKILKRGAVQDVYAQNYGALFSL